MPVEVPEIIEFNGTTFRLMGGKRKYYLSQSNTNKGRKNPKGLHVAIWEHAHGKTVPKGHVVHHIDGDSFNNDPENLECLPGKEHQSMHMRAHVQENPELFRKRLDYARTFASKWHKSEEGRAWHAKKAVDQWENPRVFSVVCSICKEGFESFHSDAKFCSGKCFQRHARATKRYHEDRICEVCSNTFSVNKYTKQTVCSRVCSHKKRI